MGGLTPSVTKITNRDLATMMVAVSDNSATNVLIDHLGMPNVERMLGSIGLKNNHLQRRMMDIAEARQGRENVSQPREIVKQFDAIIRYQLFVSGITA